MERGFPIAMALSQQPNSIWCQRPYLERPKKWSFNFKIQIRYQKTIQRNVNQRGALVYTLLRILSAIRFGE